MVDVNGDFYLEVVGCLLGIFEINFSKGLYLNLGGGLGG